jgi:hypothetical protein
MRVPPREFTAPATRGNSHAEQEEKKGLLSTDPVGSLRLTRGGCQTVIQEMYQERVLHNRVARVLTALGVLSVWLQ